MSKKEKRESLLSKLKIKGGGWTDKLSPEKKALKILVQGDSGVGKTVFASTAAKVGTTCFLDLDNGLLSTREAVPSEFVTFADEYKKGRLTTSAFLQFKKNWRKLANSEFDTLVVDSITTLEYAARLYYLEQSKHERLTLQNYGDIIMWFEQFLQEVKNCSNNVIVVAHEETVKDDVVGDIKTRPAILGKTLPSKITDYFDEVYRMVTKVGENGKKERVLLTQPGPRYTAKSRLGNLPDEMEPDFEVIYKYAKGEKNAE